MHLKNPWVDKENKREIRMPYKKNLKPTTSATKLKINNNNKKTGTDKIQNKQKEKKKQQQRSEQKSMKWKITVKTGEVKAHSLRRQGFPGALW